MSEYKGGDIVKYPNIEAERARLNLTRTELAENLSVSRKTYANWQNGKTDIPSSFIIAMTKLFGVSSDYLLGVTPTAKAS